MCTKRLTQECSLQHYYSSKLETRTFNDRRDKLIVVCSYNGTVERNENERPTTTYNMDKSYK